MAKELLGSLELNRIYQRDCLSEGGMALIPDKSIDMILCDLPYGTTACKWDTIIPFEPLWAQYERVIKDSGAIVLTASQPFTSALIMSNPKMFRYEWIWEKTTATGNMNANKMPLKAHENVLVFYKKLPTYNPQMTEGSPYSRTGKERYGKRSVNEVYGSIADNRDIINVGTRYPRTVQKVAPEMKGNRFHPTQKPVALFEYLVKTYTNEGDIVLDNCMGSGTTAVAALSTNRKFIGFETEPVYIEIANKRIDDLR
jgi:site-specific DNA-methyltransferase (adenine-specific)